MLISSYCVVADDKKINVVTFEYCRYLRNAATFKDIRAGENGLELFKVGKLSLLSNSKLSELFICVAGRNERSREQV